MVVSYIKLGCFLCFFLLYTISQFFTDFAAGAMQNNDRITIAEIANQTGSNQNILKIRLRELVNEEYVNRHGKARATWYKL